MNKKNKKDLKQLLVFLALVVGSIVFISTAQATELPLPNELTQSSDKNYLEVGKPDSEQPLYKRPLTSNTGKPDPSPNDVTKQPRDNATILVPRSLVEGPILGGPMPSKEKQQQTYEASEHLAFPDNELYKERENG